MNSKKVNSQPNLIGSAKTTISIIFLTGLLAVVATPGKSQDKGKQLFMQSCAACHTINKGRLVGPDLANIHKKQPEEWLIKYIKSSQTVIKSGDEYAVKIFKEYNQILMPDQHLSDEEIKEILTYIGSESPEEAAEDAAETKPEPTPAETESIVGDRMRGQNLFAGLQSLTNAGPSCISCHNVNSDAIISGGILAKDLTEAHTRLTSAGVSAILANPPFPKMTSAYKYKKLTGDEVADLTAFLKYVDEQRIYQHGRDYGVVLLWAGIPGAAILLIIFYFLWFKRRRGAVNHEVFDRQLRTS